MIIYYVPCKNKKEARTIAKALLEKKFVACANIIPSESMYFWDGKIRSDKEAVLILKTLNFFEDQIKEIIIKHHSYDIPAIIRLTGKINEEYLAWMENSISKER